MQLELQSLQAATSIKINFHVFTQKYRNSNSYRWLSI